MGLPFSAICGSCGTGQPVADRFCSVCGHALLEAKGAGHDNTALPFHPALSSGWLRLWVVSLPQESSLFEEQVLFCSPEESFLIGSVSKERIFSRDPYLSQEHALFFNKDGHWQVADRQSVNGTFVRIRDTWESLDAFRMMVGQQILDVTPFLQSDVETDEEGTRFYSSGRSTVNGFQVQQRLKGGGMGFCYQATNSELILGRTEGDLQFSDDLFMSPAHARISYKTETATGERAGFGIEDLLSKNGVFVSLQGPHVLRQNDWFRIGSTLIQATLL